MSHEDVLKEGDHMAKITLHKDNGNSSTSVPNRFIDEYMTSANGEFVKIYLYLLRCMNSGDCSFSISKTADKFEHTEKDVQRALKYWEKMNLLRLEYDADKNISSIYFTDSGSSESSEPAVAATPDASPVVTAAMTGPKPDIPKKPSYTANEMNAFQEKEEVQELLFVAESYLGRMLTPTDIQELLYWYDVLGFSTDLIVYLLEHCISKGHSSFHYMRKVALNWKDSGITTVEQAKSDSTAHSQTYFSVMKALGISNRNLVPKETAYIEKWSKELGFSQDIIAEACSRTISATHQPSFEYTDKILSDWHKQQVHHLSDIARLDSAYQKSKTANRSTRTASNKFNDFPQRSYDIDKLESQLLNTIH